MRQVIGNSEVIPVVFMAELRLKPVLKEAGENLNR